MPSPRSFDAEGPEDVAVRQRELFHRLRAERRRRERRRRVLHSVAACALLVSAGAAAWRALGTPAADADRAEASAKPPSLLVSPPPPPLAESAPSDDEPVKTPARVTGPATDERGAAPVAASPPSPPPSSGIATKPVTRSMPAPSVNAMPQPPLPAERRADDDPRADGSAVIDWLLRGN